MGKDFSKDGYDASVEQEVSDLQFRNIEGDFHTATSPVKPHPSEPSISFYQFFTAVDNILRDQRVTFNTAINGVYRHFTGREDRRVYDFFPLQKVKNAYQEFKDGDKNDAPVNQQVAFLILQALVDRKYKDLEKPLMAVAPKEPKVFLAENGLIKAVPKTEKIQGAVLRDDTVFAKMYREEFNAMKDMKKVPFAAVWNSLPPEMLEGHSYLSYKNGSCIGSNRDNLSIHICAAILDVYKKLPDYITKVSRDEVNGPFVLGDHFGLVVASEVAYAQIKEARARSDKKREYVISRFAALTDRMPEPRLLAQRTGHQSFLPRLEVAIILNLLAGKDVPKKAAELLNYHSQRAKFLFPGENNIAPSGIKFDQNGMLLVAGKSLVAPADLTQDFKDSSGPEASAQTSAPEMSDAFNHQNKMKPKPAGYNKVFGIVDADNQSNSLVLR